MATQRDHEHGPEEGIFPTFFMAGFECSTFIWKDGKRKDYVALTGHDRELKRDYENLMQLGIGAVREGIRWPLVDRGGGKYDWDTVKPAIEAANACQISVIWDLFHYGLPDNCDPFSDDCLKRYLDYCRAACELIRKERHRVHYFTPVNEITFYAGAGTDMGWMYPFAKGKYEELKVRLCRMAIEGVKALREVDPKARMVHVDPLIYEVAPDNRPDMKNEAERETYVKAFEAWDMLFGKLRPELGGAPEILDVVGVNVYNFSQAEMEADGSRKILGPRDPRRKPLSKMLKFAWDRYHRPIIIGETSGHQDERPNWLRMVMEESLIALNDGVNLQGVCLFPCVDMPDWQSGECAQIGLFDLQDLDRCERVPCQPYIDELRRWQKILDRPESIEADGVKGGLGRVQIEEVRLKAKEWEAHDRGEGDIEREIEKAEQAA